jgi:hypothetical protein
MKSETDAIAEAEVYIAYGREAKARAILEEALTGPFEGRVRRKLAGWRRCPYPGPPRWGPGSQ